MLQLKKKLESVYNAYYDSLIKTIIIIFIIIDSSLLRGYKLCETKIILSILGGDTSIY